MDHGILMAGLTDLSTWISFLKAALGLGVVIFVHELGHFLVAKMCGVKCEKFYVGFDPPMQIGPIKLPRALFRKQWGETEYGIGIIPLGGYVKMLGQDDNPANAAKEAERIKVGAGEGNGEVGPAAFDPRSYPAKSVPQRMAIISAGVVMNLIFAVIFATIAYQMGVSYTPCLIGATIVGDPAWQAGLQPGDRIIQLGRDAPESVHLRFIQDLKLKMFSLDVGEDVDLQIQTPTGDKRWVTLSPHTGFKKRVGTPTIGITMAHEPTVLAVFEDSVAQTSGLKPGDLVQAVTIDGERTSIQDGFQLQSLLARYPSKPLTLAVSRTRTETKTPETKHIELPTVPVRRCGLEFTIGAITVVQSGSAAEHAGFRVGDILQDINGKPVGDPMTLPTRMLDFIGTSITVTVRRGDSSQQIKVTPVVPKMITTVRRQNGPLGLETLGIGYRLLPMVQNVLPGSPADRAGIVAGDVLNSVELVESLFSIPFSAENELDSGQISDSLRKAFDQIDASKPNSVSVLETGQQWQISARNKWWQILAKDSWWKFFARNKEYVAVKNADSLSLYAEGDNRNRAVRKLLEAQELDKPVPIDARHSNWAWVFDVVEESTQLAINLTVVHEGQVRTVRLAPEPSETMFDPARGFVLKPKKEVRTAASLVEAFALGRRETWESMKQVVLVLRKINESYKNLGGPLTIAAVGTMEASEGLPRLLTFLTMLSANLAVLNFLPIPVLDGGHMVFLTYEGIFGKPVNERFAFGLTLVGFSLLMGLMVFVFVLDINRIFG